VHCHRKAQLKRKLVLNLHFRVGLNCGLIFFKEAAVILESTTAADGDLLESTTAAASSNYWNNKNHAISR
jgi:hypothetical protein